MFPDESIDGNLAPDAGSRRLQPFPHRNRQRASIRLLNITYHIPASSLLLSRRHLASVPEPGRRSSCNIIQIELILDPACVVSDHAEASRPVLSEPPASISGWLRGSETGARRWPRLPRVTKTSA